MHGVRASCTARSCCPQTVRGSSTHDKPQATYKLTGADGARLEAFVVKPRIPDEAMVSVTMAGQTNYAVRHWVLG